METTEVLEVLEGQISVFDVLSRNKLNKYPVFYSTDLREYKRIEIEAKNKQEAVKILVKRLKKKGITHFLYKFRS